MSANPQMHAPIRSSRGLPLQLSPTSRWREALALIEQSVPFSRRIVHAGDAVQHLGDEGRLAPGLDDGGALGVAGLLQRLCQAVAGGDEVVGVGGVEVVEGAIERDHGRGLTTAASTTATAASRGRGVDDGRGSRFGRA